MSFEIEYLEDTDKYLDLYYIMDLSATMEDDKVSDNEMCLLCFHFGHPSKNTVLRIKSSKVQIN